MRRVLLVRHGQSEWNAARRYQGQADPPLTALGLRQAQVAARRVPPVDIIVSSDLQRARRTADILASHLGLGPVEVNPALRERAMGEWTGLTPEEVKRRWPTNPQERPFPNGAEDNSELLARVLPTLASVRTDTALMVTHGGVIYTLEEHLGEPWQAIPNLGGRWIHVNAGDEMELGARVLLVDARDVEATAPLDP